MRRCTDACRTGGRWWTRCGGSTLDGELAESPIIGRGMRPEQAALARDWKRLSRAATFVALLTAPVFFLVLVSQNDWSVGWAFVRAVVMTASPGPLLGVWGMSPARSPAPATRRPR